ncbi:chemotaxis protein CheX [Clostridium cylindrosporum]|uniref:Inhibitor of MCP methylation n=1 Tax=Clostridium cylindrosporum DSM 605 TaxID=1121307 RepID=A0A0J8D830_CLOCY|nr:chemotaxis protein CheX [Clostridium cylindrosporum]KMT22012.1 inhibitor of MCP methylation [Clostridium cylindrosporum DSM 605]
MDIKNIDPFLDSMKSVLGQFGITDIKVSGIKKKEEMFVGKEVTSIIGLIGDLKGNVSYCMSEDTAKKVISAMMMGMSIDEIDEMGRSAVSELTNMITGNAATIMGENGCSVDISTPSMIFGKDVHLMISKNEVISVNMDTSIGEFEVNIGLKV